MKPLAGEHTPEDLGPIAQFSMNFALEFRAVRKKYGRRMALDGLDLQVPAGSVFGLVGSNGAGKTTAMAVAAGLLRISGGEVKVLGAGFFHPAEAAGRLALLPQDSRLPPHGRVAELLEYYASLQGLAPAARKKCVAQILAWTNLEDRADSRVRTLSHGMARRLAIAQAFLGEPELILLDEPLSGLDPRESARIRSMITEKRGTRTIVISSHILSDIELMCDHVAFVEKGRLVRQTTVERATGRSALIAYLLGAGSPPVERLKTELPECAIEWEQAGRVLKVRSSNRRLSVPQINETVCRALFESGVELVEIRCGSSLERAYFEATAEAVTPRPSPPGAGARP